MEKKSGDNMNSCWLPNYHQCFVCGDKNDTGLKTKWFAEEKGVKSVFIADKRYVGYENVIHGGIISALLDEAMIWAAYHQIGHFGVTAELSVRFIKPLHVGEKCDIMGWLVENKGRIWIVKAKIINQTGSLVSKGIGKVIPMPIERSQQLKDKLQQDNKNVL